MEYVKTRLTELGYAPQPCGKAGLVALAGGKKPGKIFMLRADMDALPIPEQSGEEFAAEGGNMHACGHDLHHAKVTFDDSVLWEGSAIYAYNAMRWLADHND